MLQWGGAVSTTLPASSAAGAGVESPGLRSASTAASATGTTRGRSAAPGQMGDSFAADIDKSGPIPDGSIYTEQSYCGTSPPSRQISQRSAARGSCASSSPPPSSGHGNVQRQRRFMSRHVPKPAEDLVHSELLSPEMVSRFNGLMRSLKTNTEWDEQQKQVMVSNVEALVPEEFEDMLQSEFARRCSFGSKMNTELMSSFKYMKTLQDCGAVINFDADKRGASQPGSPTAASSEGAITRASADMIFVKVLHDCDYGGKQMTYDLFCKALYLVAQAVRPDLAGEVAFSELLGRLAAVAPEDPNQMEPSADLMLDASVINMLDHFKPALHDVFNTFCNRQLESPSQASPGVGKIRLSERTFWKHTQDSMMGSFNRSSLGGTVGADGSMYGGPSPKAGQQRLSSDEADISSQDGDGTIGAERRTDPEDGLDCSLDERRLEADAGGGYAESSPRFHVDVIEPIYEDRIPSMGYDQLPSPHSGMHGNTMMTRQISSNTMMSGSFSASQDPYSYARGQPVIRNRRRHMGVNQLLGMCRDLKIMPELLHRMEIVRIFKRAQCSGSHNTNGSSLYGYLNLEAFIDAAGQLALEAYSKSPYNEEYPEPHEKITAFFLAVLPSSSREVHERFFYGCSGRGH